MRTPEHAVQPSVGCCFRTAAWASLSLHLAVYGACLCISFDPRALKPRLCAGAMALGRLRGLRALIAYPVQLTELRNPNSGPTSRSLFDWTASKSAAEPRAPPRPAQRTCGTKQWWDEYRCDASCIPFCRRRRHRRLPVQTARACRCPRSWLEDGESPKVQRLLGQERRHAEGWLRWCAALAGQLHGEMLPLVPRSQVPLAHLPGACPA